MRRLIGQGFMPCVTIEYQLRGEPLRATMLLDAVDPGATPAPLAGFHPLRDRPGVFANGELTATRSGRSWIVVEQGTGVRQRAPLLEHLSASLHTAASAERTPDLRGH